MCNKLHEIVCVPCLEDFQPKEEVLIFSLSMSVLQTYIIVKWWKEIEPMWSTVAIFIQTNVLCNICSTLLCFLKVLSYILIIRRLGYSNALLLQLADKPVNGFCICILWVFSFTLGLYSFSLFHVEIQKYYFYYVGHFWSICPLVSFVKDHLLLKQVLGGHSCFIFH